MEAKLNREFPYSLKLDLSAELPHLGGAYVGVADRAAAVGDRAALCDPILHDLISRSTDGS
jgi:hypothetical protein